MGMDDSEMHSDPQVMSYELHASALGPVHSNAEVSGSVLCGQAMAKPFKHPSWSQEKPCRRLTMPLLVHCEADAM